jgi:hypothetical protein
LDLSLVIGLAQQLTDLGFTRLCDQFRLVRDLPDRLTMSTKLAVHLHINLLN